MITEPCRSNPYIPGQCWFGDNLPSRGYKQRTPQGLCKVAGSPLYKVSKGSLQYIKMYLCNRHVESMKRLGFSLTQLNESDIINT